MDASTDSVNCNICNGVRLKTMARLWRKLGKGGGTTPPHDVPSGHLAVTVGNAGRRFVIRASYLNHPLFRQLLDQAYEEYGHHQEGPLFIPCDEFLFQDIIWYLKDCWNKSHCTCLGDEKELELSSCRDSMPLLLARRPQQT